MTLRATPAASLRQRWPTLVGLAAATVAVLTGADRETVAITVSVAALCYLASAALGRPNASWWTILGGFALVALATVVGVAPWVTLGAAAVVLVVVGLARRAAPAALGVETAGLVAYGGAAVLALALELRAGLVLAAVTLIAHVVWDVAHLRRRAVVAPSLAEACVFLDAALGTVALAAALLG